MLSFLKPQGNDGWLARLKSGLARTRERLGGRLSGLFTAGRPLDPAFYEELEAALITADIGPAASAQLIEALRARARRDGIADPVALKQALHAALRELLEPVAVPLSVESSKPFVIMLVGVNGSGKTTSIGKLARYFQGQGKSVLLAAGDTFRAAAREQLIAWGERNNVAVITQQSGDAAAVIYDAVNAAVARGTDVVLADTAGRLPTQLHLMEEIKKVKRVIAKTLPGAPHEVLLVLDANTGQNALAQLRAFDDALGVTGLVLTKLDGTAKGGSIAAIAQARSLPSQARSLPSQARSLPSQARSLTSSERGIPIRFIGVGEGLDDLRPFHAGDFVTALLD